MEGIMQENFTLKNGKTVLIRDIVPDDYDAMQIYLQTLATETIFTNQYVGKKPRSKESFDKQCDNPYSWGVGVFDGDKVIFVAPPANMVPTLMNELFTWLKNDKETPLLIKSCVFHYEFVFIHPFGDGNGRTARFWQNLLLSKWNDLFEFIPLESQIHKYQNEYYSKIATCHKNGNSNEFIEFILDMLNEVLDNVIESTYKESRHISEQVNKLLNVMEADMPYSANELLSLLNIKSKETLRSSYLNPALENGLIKMTLPDKPNSKNQKYIK